MQYVLNNLEKFLFLSKKAEYRQAFERLYNAFAAPAMRQAAAFFTLAMRT